MSRFVKRTGLSVTGSPASKRAKSRRDKYVVRESTLGLSLSLAIRVGKFRRGELGKIATELIVRSFSDLT